MGVVYYGVKANWYTMWKIKFYNLRLILVLVMKWRWVDTKSKITCQYKRYISNYWTTCLWHFVKYGTSVTFWSIFLCMCCSFTKGPLFLEVFDKTLKYRRHYVLSFKNNFSNDSHFIFSQGKYFPYKICILQNSRFHEPSVTAIEL